MSQREAAILRRNLDQFVRRQGKCIPDDLKRRVTEWLVEQRAVGVPLTALAARLGLAYGTVLRWTNAGARRAIVPVRVVTETEAPRTVRVVSPAGFSIEGLTLQEAAQLLRVLG